MKKDMWKPALMMAAVLAISLVWSLGERDNLINAPCESFGHYRVDRIPARCLKHFAGGR